MKCVVRVHRLARRDLGEAYAWAYRRAPEAADRWFGRFHEVIRSLEALPNRCALAIESRKVKIELRELHFGRRPNVFRIIFHIDGSIVRVLRIRRAQRQFLTRRQISEAMKADDPSE